MNNFSSNEPQLPGESQKLPILFQADSQKALCWFETNSVDSIISLTKQNLCFFEKDYPTPSELNSKIELNSSEPQYAPSSVVKDSVMYFTIKWKDGYYGNDRYLLSVNLDNRQLRGFQYKLPRNIGLLPTYEPQSSALLLSGDSVIVAWSDIECTDWNNLGCVGTKEINVYSLLHNDAIQTHQTFSSSSRRHDDEVSEFRSAIINGEWIMVDNLSPRILRFNNSATAFETITGLHPYLTVGHSEPETITARLVETENWNIVAVFRYNPSNSDLVIFNKNWEYITTLDFPITGLRRDVSDLIYVPEENSVFYAYSSYLPYPFASERILLQSFQLDISTDIEDGEELLPMDYKLEQNYPNPFNPTTQIEFTLPRRSDVQILIYNSLGQLVKTLLNRGKPAGTHSVIWNGKNQAGNTVSSGVYFYKLTAGDFVQSKKMILLK
ncbi:MAG: T9SS type A sorting domain-containing protein [candidate division Zixibacteria bacterium]|nr:T9SS type A sorting domain-containing protein [candidate division Zixibacteria bacterium]